MKYKENIDAQRQQTLAELAAQAQELNMGYWTIELKRKNEFIWELIEIDEVAVIQAANQHRNTLKNPPFTLDEYLQTLTKQGLIETAQVFRQILSC